MKKILFAFLAAILLSVPSCKRVCYQCNQYCAYCVARSDSSIAYKFCANKTSAYSKVDSFMRVFQDSGYICNLLNTQNDVCDNKHSINDAVSYYQKEDYFCEPK